VTAEPADVVVDEPSDATAVEERATGIEPAWPARNYFVWEEAPAEYASAIIAAISGKW